MAFGHFRLFLQKNSRARRPLQDRLHAELQRLEVDDGSFVNVSRLRRLDVRYLERTGRTVADLRLVPASAKVWRGSRLIELTAREYQLLLFCLRHPGEVISRDKILQLVWGHSESGGSNVIDVYVRDLRQKLEAGGEGRLLQTVRGQGYALAERLPPPQPEQP
jgi:DNA-binding response OmpR family regulator